MRWTAVIGCVALTLAACSGGGPEPIKERQLGPGCATADDCDAEQICLHGRCVAGPDAGDPLAVNAVLLPNPAQLSFGSVVPGEERRLSLVLENDGDVIVTLDRVELQPADAPFRVEPLGYGPFWIRPGRARAIFITYAPSSSGTYAAELVLHSAAPTVRVPLSGR